METVNEATLANGTKVKYVFKDDPPRGGMKHTFFSPDKNCINI